MKTFKFIFTVILLTVTVEAFAQRTSAGTPFADIKAGTTFSSWAVAVEAGLYNNAGYWYGGIILPNYRIRSQAGSIYSYATLVADFGYMARVFKTMDRSLNFYAGGGILLGCELADPFKMLPKTEIISFENKFAYGVRPKIVGEWFFYRNIAAVLQVDMPVNIGSAVRKVNCNTTAGIRYNF